MFYHHHKDLEYEDVSDFMVPYTGGYLILLFIQFWLSLLLLYDFPISGLLKGPGHSGYATGRGKNCFCWSAGYGWVGGFWNIFLTVPKVNDENESDFITDHVIALGLLLFFFCIDLLPRKVWFYFIFPYVFSSSNPNISFLCNKVVGAQTSCQIFAHSMFQCKKLLERRAFC